MRKFLTRAGAVRLPLSLAGVAVLAACGGGGVTNNPMNPLLPGDAVVATTDRRPPVQRIDSLSLERFPGGAVLVVNATAAVQGSYNLALRPSTVEPVDGVMRYTLVSNIAVGRDGPVVGGAATRAVTTATRFNDMELSAMDRIEVAGGDNVLALRP